MIWKTTRTMRQIARRSQFTWQFLFGKGWARLLWVTVGLALLMILLLKTIDLGISLNQTLPVLLSVMLALQWTSWIAAHHEPGLEILLACSRPFPWLTIERMALWLAGTVIIALLGGIAITLFEPGTQLLLATQTIFTAGLFLGGVGGYFTVRVRNPAFGVLLLLLVSLAFGFGGQYLLPPHIPQTPWPEPFDRFQSLLWMLQPYMGQNDLPYLSLTDFWINRLVVGGVGFALLGRMLYRLNDSESLLMTGSGG